MRERFIFILSIKDFSLLLLLRGFLSKSVIMIHGAAGSVLENDILIKFSKSLASNFSGSSIRAIVNRVVSKEQGPLSVDILAKVIGDVIVSELIVPVDWEVVIVSQIILVKQKGPVVLLNFLLFILVLIMMLISINWHGDRVVLINSSFLNRNGLNNSFISKLLNSVSSTGGVDAGSSNLISKGSKNSLDNRSVGTDSS